MPRTPTPKRRANGEGALFKEKSGRWRCRFYVDGELRTVTARSKDAAVARRDAIVKGEPEHGGSRGISVRVWLEAWLENSLPRQVKPSTVRNYSDICASYIIPAVGRVPMAQLAPRHVEAMMGKLERNGASPRTVALARTVLRRALGDALRWGDVKINAAALVRAPREQAPRLEDALSAAEAKKVLRTARGDRLEALAVLVLTMGLRQGEALSLRWRDVDLKARTVTICEAKTDAGIRTIALPAVVTEALRRHRVSSPWSAEGDFVFTTTKGTKIDRRNALRWWHELTERAGVGRRRFHASRHTAATLMLNNGVPLEVVSKTLGHAGLAITSDIYAKVGPELQRQAADVMENVLGGGGR
jgi:integrase